ncbi:BMFP domain-containing protein YqiC [Altererythrobacter atlanticus]|uniref:Membrane fusogenic activity n=1 Tax=Croceibacterium atlanticum TaxID=1267766 RepID=A0A0F7KSV1_9SPHN|nr:accessory factor UbiK family protein [Croceibacterium atlanticum]AKH42216.1 Membrane fusogenic activity [Croceibacterium atlanticum]MBB5733972.1 BMFP domain-containing protein YqiC [Croceibacterium atlanticum]
MQSENPIISDFVKLANSAAGTFAGMTREAREGARERMKEALGGLDFVSREEFDAVKDMAAKAREENEKLSERIAALEARLK